MAGHEQYLWKDPFGPSVFGAVLLSDQIHFLADEVGLIEPFEPKYLRPAAYDLRIGNAYYEDDIRRDLTDESIEIPPNGLVYIRTREKFNIPYYLIARYSLRVHQVYRGLLIDNGLHVDPGYCGYIWIPVHNFTTERRILPQGQEFISVEFNRTTRLPTYIENIKSQDELVSLGLRNELRGCESRVIKVFYKDLESYRKRNEDFTPRKFWDKFLGETHQSGMLGTERRLDKLTTDVNATVRGFQENVEESLTSFRKIGFFAAIGLIVALLGIILPICYNEYGKSREAEAQHGAEIRDLRERLQEQKNRLDAIPASQPLPSQSTTSQPIQRKGSQK